MTADPRTLEARLLQMAEKWKGLYGDQSLRLKAQATRELLLEAADHLAAARSVEPSAWQPIETALKGGFPLGFTGDRVTTDPAWVEPPKILLLCRDGNVSIAYWDWYYAEGGNGFDGSGEAWVEPCSGDLLKRHYAPAVCWMPLPNPPAHSGVGSEPPTSSEVKETAAEPKTEAAHGRSPGYLICRWCGVVEPCGVHNAKEFWRLNDAFADPTGEKA